MKKSGIVKKPSAHFDDQNVLNIKKDLAKTHQEFE